VCRGIHTYIIKPEKEGLVEQGLRPVGRKKVNLVKTERVRPFSCPVPVKWPESLVGATGHRLLGQGLGRN